MAFYGPREPGDELGIPNRYRFDAIAHLDEGEELRCFACRHLTRTVGTASYVWVRIGQDVHPATIELCAFCHNAAGGVTASQYS
jgi:hypothetical protein